MHVLMISMDTNVLSQKFGNARLRHESYAQQAGQLSMVVCNRGSGLSPYEKGALTAKPTNSRSPLHMLLDAYRVAQRLYAKRRVDVIATQDPFLTALVGLALRRRWRVPLIIQDHSSFLENPYFATESPTNMMLQWLARQTVRRADAVRVVNAQERAACIRLGLAPERVCIIPVAPNFTTFASEAGENGETADDFPPPPVILWAGRVVPVKNLPLLKLAFQLVRREMPHARLILAGTGGQLTNGENVELIESLPHDELRELYHTAAVYAHTSNYEGFGLVLAEAAASGLPVVSTATDGAREIVLDGETGYLVPIGDVRTLAEKLLALLRNPERAAEMGKRGREHVLARFNEQQLMAQWVEMWRKVATGKPPCES